MPRLPDEFRLRLIGRAIDRVGDEGPVELGKLEALKCALDAALMARTPFRRSLAGALVTLAGGTILVETAPPRRSKTLTTRRAGAAASGKNALEYAEFGPLQARLRCLHWEELATGIRPNAGQG